MNGPSTVSHSAPANEQSIGKFHVEKVPNNVFANHDDTAHVPVQTPAPMPAPAVAPIHSAPATVTDESASASRFQMIRVDRNFSRGRWKVNDYEPPENAATAINPPVNTIENEPNNPLNYTSLPGTATISNPVPPASIPTQPTNLQQPMLLTDSNVTSSATLAATAAVRISFSNDSLKNRRFESSLFLLFCFSPFAVRCSSCCYSFSTTATTATATLSNG